MAIGIAIGILIVSLAIAYQLSKGKLKKRKYLVWGMTTVLAIAPLFSWLVGIFYGRSVGDGFAGIGMMLIVFLVTFLIGLITILIGIFTKEKPKI